MKTQNRLDLMVNASMISIEQAQKIQRLIEIYKKEFGYSFDEEAAERFITHFVGMYMRTNRGESIEMISEIVIEQLLEEPSCNKAMEMLNILKEEIAPPKEEDGYFLLHLMHYLGQQVNEDIVC
ncbi:MAG: PRD domain-containing protein [Erysipelotrichaceae bacterium]